MGAFATIFVAIFIAELTDKDALLLLAISTRTKPWLAFIAGSAAFGISTTIIVIFGYILTSAFPVYWIKIVGGVVMIVYAAYEYFRSSKEEIHREEERLERNKQKSLIRFLLSIISMLVLLDLAGDATEVLTIVFVAHFQNVLLVFVSCWIALIVASAIETIVGNRLGKLFSFEKIRLFSLAIFVLIGTIIIGTTILL